MPSKYLGHPIPADSIPFAATNSTDVTDTTAQTVKAAAAAGKAHYISRVIVTNKTAGESPVILIKDGAASPVTLLTCAPGGLNTWDSGEIMPPIKATTAKTITAEATGSTGDTLVTVIGWTGTPDPNDSY